MMPHASIPPSAETTGRRIGRVTWLKSSLATDLHRAFLLNEDVAMQRTWIEGGPASFFDRLALIDCSDDGRCLQWIVRRYLDRGLSIADMPETRHLLARLVGAVRSSRKAARVLRRVEDVEHLRLVVRYAERGGTGGVAAKEEPDAGSRGLRWRTAA